MREPEPRESECVARVHRPTEELLPSQAVGAVGEHTRKGLRDQTCPRERLLVGFGRAPGNVERFGAVSEPIQRGAGALGARQAERQVDVVEDPDRPGAGAAAGHPPVGRANAVEGRPLGAGIGRRDVHDGQAAVRRGVLAGVDRRSAADCEHAVGEVGHVRQLGRDLAEEPRAGRQLEVTPARARDHERVLDPDVGEQGRKLVEPPANDHAGSFSGGRSRANWTKALAARVSARPLARTRWIWRSSSSPSTCASTSVPAARSFSTDDREMKVTP